VLSPAGDLRRTLRLKDLFPVLDKKKEQDRKFKLGKALGGATLVVDARVAGLDRRGLADDGESDIPRTADDDKPWLASTDPKSSPVIRFRVRVVEGEATSRTGLGQWRERLRFVTEQTQDGIPVRWLVVDKWKHDSSTEDDRSSGRAQLLQIHVLPRKAVHKDTWSKILTVLGPVQCAGNCCKGEKAKPAAST